MESQNSKYDKFKMIWEALLETEKERFVSIIFEMQTPKSQDSMIELAATLGVDRIYENLNKKVKEDKVTKLG